MSIEKSEEKICSVYLVEIIVFVGVKVRWLRREDRLPGVGDEGGPVDRDAHLGVVGVAVLGHQDGAVHGCLP